MSQQSSLPAGALFCLQNSKNIDDQFVEQDCEEEVESLLSGIDLDNHQEESISAGTHYLWDATSTLQKQKLSIDTIKENLKKASANVVVDNTLSEYWWYVA